MYPETLVSVVLPELILWVVLSRRVLIARPVIIVLEPIQPLMAMGSARPVIGVAGRIPARLAPLLVADRAALVPAVIGAAGLTLMLLVILLLADRAVTARRVIIVLAPTPRRPVMVSVRLVIGVVLIVVRQHSIYLLAVIGEAPDRLRLPVLVPAVPVIGAAV
jgi:hypothetical protein